MLNGDSLPKASRGQHIQTCVRWEMASRLGHLQKDIHYCYHCFSWVIGEDWDPHCQAHLADVMTKWCGTVTHCHTLMRPGYCPFCMADKTIPAPERLVSWVRDHQLWDHVEEHLEAGPWPRNCPHPLCGASVFVEAEALRYHLVDEHRFSRKRAKKPVCPPPSKERPQQSIPSREITEIFPQKRKQTLSAEALQWVSSYSSSSTGTFEAGEPVIRSRKRHRPSPPAICPSALSLQEDWVGGFTYSAPPTPQLSNKDSYEDGNNGCLLKHADDLPSPRFVSPDSTCGTPVSYDDEILFSQYLRSPSPSPIPSTDCAVSESNDATLVALPQRPSCGKLSGLSSVNAVHEGPTTGLEETPSRVRSKPRIRLRVNQPKITLRLSVPRRVSRAPEEEGNASKRRCKQQSREERRGAKFKGTPPKKAKGRRKAVNAASICPGS